MIRYKTLLILFILKFFFFFFCLKHIFRSTNRTLQTLRVYSFSTRRTVEPTTGYHKRNQQPKTTFEQETELKKKIDRPQEGSAMDTNKGVFHLPLSEPLAVIASPFVSFFRLVDCVDNASKNSRLICYQVLFF